jgi:hypothetical protein
VYVWWMMHSRCSRRPCPWRWCRSPPSGGANTSRRLRCRSSRSSRRSSPPPVPYRDGYPVPLRDHAVGITRVRASCGRSSALRSHRAACRSRASCAMAEKRLSRDDRLINPRSFVDLLHWDVARDTNWDKITERRNGNQSSEGQPIFDMREFRSNKKRLSRFPPDHHPRNPTFSERSTHERIYSSEMTPFSDT